MTTNLAAFTPEVAREILETVRWVRSAGFALQGGARGELATETSRPTAKNEQGSTMPAWALVQLTGTANVGDRPVPVASRPADTMGQAGPYAVAATGRTVADDDYFALQLGPVLRILTDGSAITAGSRWSPSPNQWHLVPDVFGQFEALGADPIDDVGLFLDRGLVTLRRGKADATITAGSSGTVSLFDGTTDTAQNVTAWWDWANDDLDIEAETEVWVAWSSSSERWEIVGGACAP